MNKTRAISLLFCFLFLMFAGCSRQVTYQERNQISLNCADKTQAMAKAEKVLTKMQFSVAKFDPESGVIQCRPLRGAQWFEFWRKDNVGKFNKAEANLHTLRRIVTVEMMEQGGQLIIKCDALTQKLDLTDKKDAKRRRGGSQVYDLLSDSGEKMQTLNMEEKKMTWIDLGQDRQLEAEILTRIENCFKGNKI